MAGAMTIDVMRHVQVCPTYLGTRVLCFGHLQAEQSIQSSVALWRELLFVVFTCGATSFCGTS